MPSRRARKRGRGRVARAGAQAAARRGDRGDPPARGGSGGRCGLWADASLSELRLLRKAIRQGWPVPQERCGPIMEEVLPPLHEKTTPPRLLIAIACVVFHARK